MVGGHVVALELHPVSCVEMVPILFYKAAMKVLTHLSLICSGMSFNALCRANAMANIPQNKYHCTYQASNISDKVLSLPKCAWP